jgi:hypothetical protein
MKENDTTSLYVDWTHLQQADMMLSQAVEGEFYRYEPYRYRL